MAIQSPNIFSTVPEKDYLALSNDDGTPKYQEVVNFLEFKKEDVSKAIGVPLNSVRYDRIPGEVRERIREWTNLLNLVAEHFDGNAGKTLVWLTTPNPLLGGVSPRDMIRFGRHKKLFKFVVNALSENRR